MRLFDDTQARRHIHTFGVTHSCVDMHALQRAKQARMLCGILGYYWVSTGVGLKVDSCFLMCMQGAGTVSAWNVDGELVPGDCQVRPPSLNPLCGL